jgi:single-strand DNA-binding protein
MAFIRVEQRNARFAGPVKVDTVQGKESELTRGVVTVISNTRRGTNRERTEEATVIRWTLWGRLAENAAQYLGKGSRVNVIGWLCNDRYTDGDGREVFGFSFTCDELDYLDSKNESEARKGRQQWTESYEREEQAASDRKPVPPARTDRERTATPQRNA